MLIKKVAAMAYFLCFTGTEGMESGPNGNQNNINPFLNSQFQNEEVPGVATVDINQLQDKSSPEGGHSIIITVVNCCYNNDDNFICLPPSTSAHTQSFYPVFLLQEGAAVTGEFDTPAPFLPLWHKNEDVFSSSSTPDATSSISALASSPTEGQKVVRRTKLSFFVKKGTSKLHLPDSMRVSKEINNVERYGYFLEDLLDGASNESSGYFSPCHPGTHLFTTGQTSDNKDVKNSSAVHCGGCWGCYKKMRSGGIDLLVANTCAKTINSKGPKCKQPGCENSSTLYKGGNAKYGRCYCDKCDLYSRCLYSAVDDSKDLKMARQREWDPKFKWIFQDVKLSANDVNNAGEKTSQDNPTDICGEAEIEIAKFKKKRSRPSDSSFIPGANKKKTKNQTLRKKRKNDSDYDGDILIES
ncbi:MAG: hypothetical protein LBB63_04275 [Holosporaceae bacterium]|jgi:hypothetical protein|nr:hypothetical protein [Holosporaceae bacterium]